MWGAMQALMPYGLCTPARMLSLSRNDQAGSVPVTKAISANGHPLVQPLQHIKSTDFIGSGFAALSA